MKYLCPIVQKHIQILFMTFGYITALPITPTLGQMDRFVSTNSPSSISPYTNWNTAARTIQDAIDAASDGDTIWVINGVYSSGEYPLLDRPTNRVAIDKALLVRSVNGPEVTIIQGSGTSSDVALRCVYITNGAVLSGFTLTNGYATVNGGGAMIDNGGIITNCVIIGNTSDSYGGGVFGGTLYNCTLAANCSSRGGGGSADSTLYNCTVSNNTATGFGGGVSGGTLYNSALRNNYAWWGGGSSGSTLYNCMVVNNSVDLFGGGANGGTLYNCIILNNTARYGGGGYNGRFYNCSVLNNAAACRGGGSYGVTLCNCIVYYNKAAYDNNWSSEALFTSYSHVCTLPMPPGEGNITNAPGICSLLNPRLLPVSLCINNGMNIDWMTDAVDFDGDARIINEYVDIGAYEYAGQASLTGDVEIAISAPTSVVIGYSAPLHGEIHGRILGVEWDFGDGTHLANVLIKSHL